MQKNRKGGLTNRVSYGKLTVAGELEDANRCSGIRTRRFPAGKRLQTALKFPNANYGAPRAAAAGKEERL